MKRVWSNWKGGAYRKSVSYESKVKEESDLAVNGFNHRVNRRAQTRRNVSPTTNWPQKYTICRRTDKGCIAEGRDAFLQTNGIAVSRSTTNSRFNARAQYFDWPTTRPSFRNCGAGGRCCCALLPKEKNDL